MIKGSREFLAGGPSPTKSGSHKCCPNRGLIYVSSNVGRLIDMINLLQSVTTQVYYKVQQVVITKCIKYYNV